MSVENNCNSIYACLYCRKFNSLERKLVENHIINTHVKCDSEMKSIERRNCTYDASTSNWTLAVTLILEDKQIYTVSYDYVEILECKICKCFRLLKYDKKGMKEHFRYIHDEESLAEFFRMMKN